MVSLRVGQTTFLVSATASLPKAKKRCPGSVNQATAAPAATPASTDEHAQDQRLLAEQVETRDAGGHAAATPART